MRLILFPILFALVQLVIAPVSFAKLTYGNYTVSEYHRAYDGDTFYVSIDALPPLIGENIAIRLVGVDTPELRGTCAYEKTLATLALDFTHAKLVNAKTIELRNVSRDNFFRIDAEVYIDGVSLNEQLLNVGLAKSYDDPTRKQWCN